MNPRSKPPDPSRQNPEAPEIRAQLERILESPPFRTSRRSSDFLRHVVEGTVEGRADSLKERTLGVAVFDRQPDYDTNQDPVVRNTAGQVRKRLAQYYCEPGREQELRIDLPPGSYVPEIYKPAGSSPVVAEPVVLEPPPSPERPPSSRTWLWGVGALLILAAGVGIYFARPQPPGNVELFWAPLLKRAGTVVLCVGQGHTYKLNGNWDRVFEAEAGTRGGDAGSKTSVPLGDVVPAWDRYVGLNDAQAVVRFTSLFTRFGKDVELRGGRTTSLEDLRGRPVVLIGAFNNEWTLNLTGELRFYFDDEPQRKMDVVRDRLHPDNRSWEVRNDVPVTQIPVDYAIVSRVFNATTEQAVVVAAGLRGGGTYAAGEFLTNPTYLERALKNAPPHWEAKNVQFVLSTRMFSGSPGPAQVVSAHYW